MTCIWDTPASMAKVTWHAEAHAGCSDGIHEDDSVPWYTNSALRGSVALNVTILLHPSSFTNRVPQPLQGAQVSRGCLMSNLHSFTQVSRGYLMSNMHSRGCLMSNMHSFTKTSWGRYVSWLLPFSLQHFHRGAVSTIQTGWLRGATVF